MIKTLFKIILFLVFILVFALGTAVATSNLWMPRAITATIQGITGLPVTISKVQIDFRGTQFGVYGIKIKNPSGFGDQLLASIPEIFVDFDLNSFFKDGKLHFELIRLNLQELSIIRNEHGVTNLDNLKTLRKDKTEAAVNPEPIEPGKPQVKRHLIIDEFVLTIRNVRYQDRSLPVPIDRTVDLKINQEVFRGITNFGDVIRVILMKIIYNTSFSALGAPVDLLKQQFSPSLLKGEGALIQSAEIATLMGTQMLGEGRKFVEGATNKIPVSVPMPAEVNQIKEEVKGKAAGWFKNAERFVKNTSGTLSERTENKSDSSQSQS